MSGRHALEQLPDNELVLEALGGDAEAALTELIRRYAPRLRRLLYTLVGGDTDLMEDAEQEVFVALVRRLGSFRGDSAFSTFFYALARNRVTDLLRSRRRRRHRYREMAEPDQFAARTAGPERQAIDLERVEMLRAALDVLTPNDRVMLLLKDGDGESITELAAIFGLRPGTVKSRLSRARARVTRRMKEIGYE